MEDLPEWFVNLMLDIYNELNSGNNLDKFKNAGTATLVDTMEDNLHIKGYAIIDAKDTGNVIVIGKRTEIKDEEKTEFLKHIICLPKKE